MGNFPAAIRAMRMTYSRKKKAKIVAYDPQAAENTKRIHPEIEYAPTVAAALAGAHAAAILTDWPEFKKLTDADFAPMASKVILEGRRALDRTKVSNVEGICW